MYNQEIWEEVEEEQKRQEEGNNEQERENKCQKWIGLDWMGGYLWVVSAYSFEDKQICAPLTFCEGNYLLNVDG